MAEPVYVRQVAVAEVDDLRAWCRRVSQAAAREKGCGWFRFSMAHGLMLVEGWIERPDDEGAPRYALEGEAEC